MNESEIIEGNKLIDEFMGRTSSNWNPSHQRIDYDNRWNMLMPVVEKIESLSYEVLIWKRECRITGTTNIEYRKQTSGESKIVAAWQGIVDFIKSTKPKP